MGDLDSAVNLALINVQGLAGAPDPCEALKWFRVVAEANDPRGHNGVGNAYATGACLEASPDKAINSYWSAASMGHAVAQNNLGGQLLPRAKTREALLDAIAWFGIAAESNYAPAVENFNMLSVPLSMIEKERLKGMITRLRGDIAARKPAP